MLSPFGWIDVLTESMDSMSFLKRRKASKWHLRIDSAVSPAGQSSATASRPDGILLARAQLGALTKDFLGSKKRTQEEKDRLLEELINNHALKTVAFAACVAELSVPAVNRLLNELFPVSSTTLHGLHGYLQAFISVAQARNDIFSAQDQSFAATIVPVVASIPVDGQVRADNAEALLDAWNDSPPSDARLRERARILTQRIVRRMAADLARFNTELAAHSVPRASCERVFHYRQILSRVRTNSAVLTDILEANLSGWSRWACWQPDQTRLRLWAECPSNGPFIALLELEGPDLSTENNQGNSSVWQALIRRGQLLSWLESKGYSLAVGLLTGDTEPLLTLFVKEFLDAVVSAHQNNRTDLLQHLISRDGLDLQPLRACQSAYNILHPEFIALVLQRSRAVTTDTVNAIVEGLRVLSRDVTGSVRRTLPKEIAHCVNTVADQLLEDFRTRLMSMGEWIQLATRLWQLRGAVGASGWLHTELRPELVDVCRFQAHDRSLAALYDLHCAVQLDTGSSDSDLATAMLVYTQAFVAEGRSIDDESTIFPRVLHNLWMSRPSPHTREAVLLITSLDLMGEPDRIACINSLQNGSATAVQELRECLTGVMSGEHVAIIGLTDAIVSLSSSSEDAERWRKLLAALIKRVGLRLQDTELIGLGFSTYRRWIATLYKELGDDVDKLRPIHEWMLQLEAMEATIEIFEREADSDAAMRCIMTGYRAPEDQHYLEMLHCYGCQEDQSRLEMMRELILALRPLNSEAVLRAVVSVGDVGTAGFTQCQNLITACHENRDVASARLVIWLRSPEIETNTSDALLNLARISKLQLTYGLSPPASSLQPCRDYYAAQVARLIAMTQKLEDIRSSLKRKAPAPVVAMMEELGLEQVAGADALMVDLPAELVSFVDATTDDHIELHFPLSDPNMTAIQRLAFGLDGTETLSVHLRIGDTGEIDGFCVHLDDNTTTTTNSQPHSWFANPSAPDTAYCYGRLTRLTYIVSRILWRGLQKGNHHSIQVVYEGVRESIRTSATRCMVCDASINAQLHRPTYCAKPACQASLLRANLDLRLQDLRTDGRVIDMLLTSVFAVATVGNLALLLNCPSRINDPRRLLSLLNSLPATTTLTNSPDFSAGLRRYGQRAELLMSWLCNSHRSFIVSAQGQYRIPNMPNVQQFLMVNANPEVEARYAQHNHLQPRTVLFHGTTMDRLYAILVEGLRVLSGTALAPNGAARGRGIYLATDPSMAYGYARASASVGAFFTSRASFMNAGVLLGCEYAGSPTGGGIHVETDPSRVMVRYIFIFSPGRAAPLAQHIVGPMQSTFNSLRSMAGTARPGPSGGSGGLSDIFRDAGCPMM